MTLGLVAQPCASVRATLTNDAENPQCLQLVATVECSGQGTIHLTAVAHCWHCLVGLADYLCLLSMSAAAREVKVHLRSEVNTKLVKQW